MTPSRASRGRARGKAPARPGARPPARGGAPRAGIALSLALVAVATVAVYAGVFHHAFVRWDDPTYVEENPLVLGQQTGPLLQAVVARNYHPLTMLSLAWNVSSPLSPRPFLATNLVLHILNSSLVFWLAYLLFRRSLLPSLFVALLFAIHPMHVESVAWVSERKDVLYSFFFLAGAITYWRYLDTKSWTWLAATFGLFLLSCLSKAVAVTFPLVMVLLDFWRRRSLLERKAWLEKVPFFAASALFGLIAVKAQKGENFLGLLTLSADRLSAAIPKTTPFTLLQRLTFPCYGHLQYVWKLFVPVKLAAFYPYPSNAAEAGQPIYYLAVAFFAATAAVFLWSLRHSRVVAFGLGWYFVTVAPVMQWVPVGSAIMADRYTYLPYVGLFFILATGVATLAARRPSLRTPLWALCGLFAALLMFQTPRVVETWRDTETLWSNVIRYFPRTDRAYAARGNYLGRSGRIQEAMRDLQSARELNPLQGEIYEDLGNAYGSMGKLDSALVMFDQALRLDPTLGHTYYNRAIAYLRIGRPREALSDLAQAEKLMPELLPTIHFPRGNANLQTGDYRGAVDEFSRAIEAGEAGADAYMNRGVARTDLGDASGAASDFREALRLNPNLTEAQARLRALSGAPR